MGLSITVGSVTITINAAASADPVSTHPVSAPATYSAFAEVIGGVAGLARIIFDALPAVVSFNDPDDSRVKWPPFYGTTDTPWGQPADPVTGYRERQCVDNPPDFRWTDNIHNSAANRKSFLENSAESAFAIATGIKRAIEDNFKVGSSVLSGPTSSVSADIASTNVNIFLTRKGPLAPGHQGVLSVGNITPGTPGSFEVFSTDMGEDGDVSWLVVGQ